MYMGSTALKTSGETPAVGTETETLRCSEHTTEEEHIVHTDQPSLVFLPPARALPSVGELELDTAYLSLSPMATIDHPVCFFSSLISAYL